jgi:hypothetical protein
LIDTGSEESVLSYMFEKKPDTDKTVILKGFGGKQKKARKLMKETEVIVYNNSTQQKMVHIEDDNNCAILGMDECRNYRVHFDWKRNNVTVSKQ